MYVSFVFLNVLIVVFLCCNEIKLLYFVLAKSQLSQISLPHFQFSRYSLSIHYVVKCFNYKRSYFSVDNLAFSCCILYYMAFYFSRQKSMIIQMHFFGCSCLLVLIKKKRNVFLGCDSSSFSITPSDCDWLCFPSGGAGCGWIRELLHYDP